MAIPELDKASLKRMAASWIVAFPTVMVLLLLLGPVMTDWPLIARTFVLVSLIVPIMSIATPALLSRLEGSSRDCAAKK